MSLTKFLLPCCLLLSLGGALPAHAQAKAPLPVYSKKASWAETLQAGLESIRASGSTQGLAELMDHMEADYPNQWDWVLQDTNGKPELLLGNDSPALFAKLIQPILQEIDSQREIGSQKEISSQGDSLRTKLRQLQASPAPVNAWMNLYENACLARHTLRLAALGKKPLSIVFTRHYNMGGSHYAYTEGQSDAQAERRFTPGSALCVLELDGGPATTSHVRTLLEDKTGVIRDPAVSYDGKRILFSWKKSALEDDYHLYEMEANTGKIRQLTFGLGFADYEGSYLPNGEIVFNSTRCVQTVDCWYTEVSNLYTCDGDGRFLRRLTFDQVHDNYPTVTNDGRVIYTRWEYNDRGQLFPQPLFQMNPDGTGQTELYGNNSWFPTAILHARAIPGSQKFIGIISGHHTKQTGKLGIIDPSKGRQEASGIQLIAPVRETKAERIDAYGQEGDQFQYPWPLNEEACLVSYHPLGSPQKSAGPKREIRYKIYLMNRDGRRELLAADPTTSCNQPFVLAPRDIPPQRASTVDYRKSTGTFSMQNIYAGQALPGVKPGTVKKLRVVALDFRAAAVGRNGNGGEAGGALVSTPPSISNGSWDPKIVLGDATVYEDGSAFFQAPAQTPLYFIALDEKGRMVQTMRSWATLQPGENASCIGCHEEKDAPALATRSVTKAMQAGAQALAPFYGPPRAFSFSTEIQPILNQHCIKCHDEGLTTPLEGKKPGPSAGTAAADSAPGKGKFSLTSHPNPQEVSGRVWSDAYLNLTANGKGNDLIKWVSPQSAPPMLAPYAAGSSKGKLLEMLEKGHSGVKISKEELDKLACWIDLLIPFCGDYTEATCWSAQDSGKYDSFLLKRRKMQEAETANLSALLSTQTGQQPAVTIQPIASNGTELPPDSGLSPGDRLEICGPPYMMVRPSPSLPESLVYCPQGRLIFPVPSPASPYPPALLAGTSSATWSARPAKAEEIGAYRNLVLNPLDVRGLSTFFPHATSNSECRNDPVFAARNVIDGVEENKGHGKWPMQSWGPDKRADLWLRLDWGQTAEVDKLVLLIRADFPHDSAWTGVTLRFSDGSTETIQIQKTAQPQSFAFAKRKASWVQLEKFTQPEPMGWCALSEVQVWGRSF